MPTFYRSKSKKPVTLTHRTFVAHSKPKPNVKPQRVQPALEAVDKRLLHVQASSTIDSLNELLQQQTKPENRSGTDEVAGDNAVFTEDSEIETFDGVSNLEEQEELFDTAIDYERKKAKVVENQVKVIEEEREKERRAMENEIKELRRELHRTAPLHDTKFFSLSKELKEAILEIEKVAGPSLIAVPDQHEEKQVPLPAEAFKEPGLPPVDAPIFAKVVSKPPVADIAIPTSEPVKEATPAEVKPKNLSKKKMLITGASAIAFLIVVSNVVASNLGSQSKVDKKIVDAYLTKQSGQVQGASTQGSGPPSQTEGDPSLAEVSFDQSIWEEFNDPSFGIMLQYPKNAVKAIRTDSNITFVRKTGYLFKIQRIETSLSLNDYWAQIKPTSLNFAVTDDTFKGKPALKLALEDLTDYPGDRIMVKEGGFIYDIWYATPSKIFTQDDIQRVEKMLASLSVVGAK